MSPEIILGKGHDKAADWWSVGVLLFEMLTGKVTFPISSFSLTFVSYTLHALCQYYTLSILSKAMFLLVMRIKRVVFEELSRGKIK